jgi:hypothetical protein
LMQTQVKPQIAPQTFTLPILNKNKETSE